MRSSFTPPETQQLRAKKIGHTILNTTVDRPWSQYFCCMISASADYVNKYPVATKRVLQGHPQGRRPLRVGSGMECSGSWSIEVSSPATTTPCRR